VTRATAHTDIISTMDPKGPRVTIEFETTATTDRIAGRLLDDHGASVPFDGWLGLAAGLERILAPTREPQPPTADNPRKPK
jgi:hypothetical protein